MPTNPPDRPWTTTGAERALAARSLDQLTIDDEASLAGVALYARLKQALRRSGYRFWIPAAGTQASWDRVLFLNLTYWDSAAPSDVLCDDHVPADVVAHAAWHQVVGRELERLTAAAGQAEGARPTALAMFFAESIASAFDLYLVGRLVQSHPESDFVTSQLPLMAACANEAGMSEGDFQALVEGVARDPERAFEDLRALLLDAVRALHACGGVEQAHATLERLCDRRFAALLHHFQLSNWILYGRAYGADAPASDAALTALDAELRRAPASLDWLAGHWIDADLDAVPDLRAPQASNAGG